MKTPPHTSAQSALSLLELLVVVAVVAVAAIVFLRGFFPRTRYIGYETHALSNAKQIVNALNDYAVDHDGKYPSTTLRDGKPTTTPVSNSNAAFAQLFPVYVDYEYIFWLKNSAFCSKNIPDEVQDKTPLDTPVKTLDSGENEWAYVLGLGNKSNPPLPVVADGFASSVSHTYSRDNTEKGGVWKGLKAIVVYTDVSSAVMRVDQDDLTVHRFNGGPTPGDLFTTANAANGWLQPANVVVNPK